MLFRRKKQNSLASIASFFWPQKGFIRGWMYLVLRILRLRSSDYSLAAGLASGVAVSFTPLIGFHFFMAAAVAWMLRGNIIMAMIGTLVGNPWTFPLIWVLIHSVGVSILGYSQSEADVSMLSHEFLMQSPGPVLVSMLLGGLIMGLTSGLLVFVFFYRYAGKIREKLNAIKSNRQHNNVLKADRSKGKNHDS